MGEKIEFKSEIGALSCVFRKVVKDWVVRGLSFIDVWIMSGDAIKNCGEKVGYPFSVGRARGVEFGCNICRTIERSDLY
jgi:hypothetical protein